MDLSTRKVLCVQLCFHQDYRDAGALASTYNDGIYYVASFLQHEFPGLQMDMCQMFWGENPDDYALETYDYILISALAAMFHANRVALETIRRRKKPSCKIVFGGPHASFAPHEVLQYGDYAVLAEGEVPAAQLIRCLESGDDLATVDNLCYRGGDGRLVINRIARYGSIDNMINPALLRSDKRTRIQWAAVSMSRGCPFNCSFCYSIRILGRQFRSKSVDTIRRELQGINAEIGARRFYVSDINFATNKQFCHAVANGVRDLEFKYIAMTRIELADDIELVRDLKSAGFEEYYIGVESEQPQVLRTFNKRCDVSRQTERLLALAEEDIYVQSGIMFGLDFQDEAAIAHSARWCAEARIPHPIFMCLAEYPFQALLFGSHQDVEDHRVIIGGPTYQHYSYVGIFPRHMRPSVLQRRILEAYGIFFQHAFEIESRPQRRMRLKNHARCVKPGNEGMVKHIQFLEEIEKPYYTSAGRLKEDLLKLDFEGRHGELLEALGKAARPVPLGERVYAH
jgi:anaerobic magnesium-protoporphyrin IX monomethyl ester cyclase